MLKTNFKESCISTKRLIFSAAAVLLIFIALFAFVSCEANNPGSDPDLDLDDSLLPRLTGTWQAKGGEGANAWTDDYVITNASVTRISSQSQPTTKSGSIEYVYNFSNIAGCIIVKYGDTEYNAVYFNNLLSSTGTVDLVSAYVATDGSSSAVKSLAEAKERFRPENAETYGGGDTQPSTRHQRFPDTHTLNSQLTGTWQASGGEGANAWTDDYVITNASVTHISSYGGGAPTTVTGSIEHVYNITKTAGCIIIKYTEGENSGKYDAVYFKDLGSTQVILGSAYTVADYTVPAAVSTLDAAKGRFKPANAEAYGGWTAQMGTPQQKFNDDNQLNASLAGTWTASGGEGANAWTDTYTITLGAGGSKSTISHPGDYGYTNAEIEYVYNITDTAGCIVIKYTANGADKYSAVYFKDLSTTQVLLGNAYTVADYTVSPAVDSLDDAKEKFKPANAEAYGGWTAQIGTPQQKEQSSN
jgi:hypothetical protein